MNVGMKIFGRVIMIGGVPTSSGYLVAYISHLVLPVGWGTGLGLFTYIVTGVMVAIWHAIQLRDDEDLGGKSRDHL